MIQKMGRGNIWGIKAENFPNLESYITNPKQDDKKKSTLGHFVVKLLSHQSQKESLKDSWRGNTDHRNSRWKPLAFSVATAKARGQRDTVGGNGDWCRHCGKQCGDTSENEKWVCLLTQQSHFWESIQRNPKHQFERHKHPYVHCSVIYNCQDMEAAHVSVNRWVDETTTGHLSGGILLGCKKENSTLCNSMDGLREHYAKWIKPEKDKYHMISLICGI